MDTIEIFEKHAQEYDKWFDENRFIYESQVLALRDFIPKEEKWLEVGVGTGRFAGPFGIKIEVEPAKAMADIARNRKIEVYDAKVDPFDDESFDFILMVTSCNFCLEGDEIMNLGKTKDKVIKPIYLDYNATTPHDPEIIAGMQSYLETHFGTLSSSHWYGIQTENAVENAHRLVASLLNCQPEEIVFTSGGTESNNYAIKGIAFANQDKWNHIITTQITGAACHSGGVCISYVFKAVNVLVEWARGRVRFSTCRITAESEIRTAINIITNAVTKLGTRQPKEVKT